MFDYPALTSQDAALAALFARNDFKPSAFQPTQLAVYAALGALAYSEAVGVALPPDSTVLGKNVALVRAQRRALASVGVALRVSSSASRGPSIAATWEAHHKPTFDSTGVGHTPVFAPLPLRPGTRTDRAVVALVHDTGRIAPTTT